MGLHASLMTRLARVARGAVALVRRQRTEDDLDDELQDWRG